MSNNIRKLTYGAVAAAIIFVVTRIIVIPVTITTTGAYVNFGDVAIYFISYLLGGPIAAIAAGVGSALSDVSLGYIVYAPATLIIKGLMALTAGLLMKNRNFGLYAAACALGGAIMLVGYALYETMVFGFPVAIANAVPNLFQWGGSLAAALILFPVAKRVRQAAFLNKL